MDKEIMLTKIKKYLAEKYQCDVSELDKSGLNIIINNKQNRLKMHFSAIETLRRQWSNDCRPCMELFITRRPFSIKHDMLRKNSTI